MPQLTVGSLKDIIRDLPDDMLIAVDGYEGDYDIPAIEVVEVIKICEETNNPSYFGTHVLDDNGVDVLYISRFG